MKRILRYWQGAVLGVLATFTATPTLAAIADDQKAVFSAMLPVFIAVATVAYAVICVRNHEFKSLFKGVMVGGISLVVSLFLVDLL